MAELRKIVPRPALSDFRQQVTPGPNAFDVLSGMAQKAYDFLEPAAIEEMKRKGTAEGIALAQGGGYTVTPSSKSSPVDPGATPLDPSSPEGIAGDAMAALGKGGDWLKYSNQGATRNDPLDPKLVDAMSFLGPMGITMDVVSGGQEAAGEGGSRTGSTRHDHGGAGDVDFYKDGRKLVPSNPDDKAILTQIIQTAKGRGVTGFGEGDDYMGSGRVHLGFGNPGVWGAGGKGANAPSWLVDAYNGAPSGAAPTVSTKDAPVMVRTKDGRVEPRLFSPMSGPILQAHTAAAGAAYISEKMVQGQTDLITMAGEFALNPQGFQQAAESYIGQMIEDAPDMFRTDLQSELRSQAQRTFLGIVEDQQRDTRQRAANSSSALVERWASDYTDAIAGGNADEAAAAEAKLRSVLKARETLPGLAWTPEQSDNIIFGARDAAAKAIEDNQKAVTSGWKDTLKTMVDAVKNGLTPTGTELLGMPEVQAALPDEWAEAMAMTGFHGALPSFMAAPKAARDATIADMESVPISEGFQVDIVKAGREANKAVTDAFEKSPMDAAGAYLPEKPPALPDLGSPDAVKGLAARADYSRRLVETGHAPYLSFFTEEESATLGLAMSKEASPEDRLAAVGAIIEGFGGDAPRALAELKMDDPSLKMSGMLMAAGKEKNINMTGLALEAAKGQALLDEGLVQAPPEANTIDAVAPDIAGALSYLPESAQADAMAMATSLYAARARGVTDKEQQKEIMKEAIQSALGQATNKKMEVTGGVQSVGGYDVLLPLGMTSEAAEGALGVAFGTTMAGRRGHNMIQSPALADMPVETADFWAKAGPYGQPGSIPMMGGEPVSPSHFANGRLRITPVSGSVYRMDYVSGDGLPIQVRDEKGGAFIFDLDALTEATK